ncbi:hypothetical protein CEY00_Acc31239 [Actinidia chinensis var. chinensis]|uniref:Uncharacterized protein n=1 Tax=Actinidia chinensis var. chinensis TaxID=1590841 RepID=A0A2R6PB51_ACTCC|nr:hypothetical protein CEY00_Acc31239 [Actinidia chinensis var. chinensis]
MGEESLESTNPRFLRRVASGLSKLKNSAVQLMPFISNTPADESPDLEAYGASTHHFIKDSQTNSTTSSSNTTELNSFSSQSSNPTRSPDPNEPICECQDDQKKLSNPIAQAFREVELGKVFLAMVMPISTIILAVPNRKSSPMLVSSTLCLISAAMVCLFYGNSLRNVSPKIANALEQLGTACIYASFFMAVGSHLPPPFAWFPLVCFIACVTLSVLSCLGLKKKKCHFCNKVLKSS